MLAYFNELDTYAQSLGLIANRSLKGRADPALALTTTTPLLVMVVIATKRHETIAGKLQSGAEYLIRAIVDLNTTRKDFIADAIIKRKPGSETWSVRLSPESNEGRFHNASRAKVFTRDLFGKA